MYLEVEQVIASPNPLPKRGLQVILKKSGLSGYPGHTRKNNYANILYIVYSFASCRLWR